MNIFDLIDRWHQRRCLLKLIKAREKEIANNRRDIGYIPRIECNKERQRELAEYILRDEPKIKEEIEIYKSKLRQLL